MHKFCQNVKLEDTGRLLPLSSVVLLVANDSLPSECCIDLRLQEKSREYFQE
jgi:hypothetical protein